MKYDMEMMINTQIQYVSNIIYKSTIPKMATLHTSEVIPDIFNK